MIDKNQSTEVKYLFCFSSYTFIRDYTLFYMVNIMVNKPNKTTTGEEKSQTYDPPILVLSTLVEIICLLYLNIGCEL